MDIQQLRYFAMTAKLEHVTQAARELGIAQPALSQSMHKLEKELGVRLFARQGRNLRLTAEGVYLRERLSPILADLEEARLGLLSFTEAQARTIRICIATASVISIDAIALFSRDNADVRFEVNQDVTSPSNDIIVSMGAGKEGHQSSETRASFSERIFVAMQNATHGGTSFKGQSLNPVIELDGLADERFISLAKSSAFRRTCDDLCNREGFTPNIIFESDNPAVVRKMIGLGMGVGFWPEFSWGKSQSDDVEILPLANENFARKIDIRLTPQGMEKDAARDFFDRLVSYFESHWN